MIIHELRRNQQNATRESKDY
jgi:serine/threonine protein kinase